MMPSNTIRIFLCSILLSLGVHAAEPRTFEIQAGDAAEALRSFSNQSGLQMLFEYRAIKGRQTQALSGAFEPKSALALLLRDSGLVFEFVNDNTVAVRKSKPSAEDSAAAAPLSMDERGQFTEMSNEGFQLAQAGSTQKPGERSEAQEPLSSSTKAQDEGKVEEIIVTAQKRQERLQDVPVSISVISGAQIDNSSARAVTDVLSQIGGVSVIEIQPGQTRIAVRGVVPGSGSNTTAYYLDEVPFAFNRNFEVPDTNAFDLSRIEVLRGPQGTLYGANSLSGVVRILNNDADLNAFEFKGRTRVSSTDGGGGNYGVDGAVNVPLVPGRLAVRAVAGYSELSGFISSALDGQKKINDTRAQNYRLKLGWQPLENLSVKLGYARSEVHNGAPSRSFDDSTTAFSSDQPTNRLIEVYSLIAEYDWRNVSLLSSTGYIDYDVRDKPQILLGGGTSAISFSSLTPFTSFNQEFRFVSHLDGPWQWSAGALYADAKETLIQDARSAFAGVPSFAGVLEQVSLSEYYGVFADATRWFGEGRFGLTAGVRYFNDTQTMKDVADFNPAARLSADQKVEFSKTTGRLVLTYKPKEGSMFYASAAQGFRSGALQAPAVARAAPDLPGVNPDSLMNYEIGTKGLVSGTALSYDMAVYYTDWKDIQQSLILPPPNAFNARVNAGRANGMGVDAALSYHPSRALDLWVSAGWNDLQFAENIFQFSSTPAPGRNVLFFAEGARPNDSPEWTGAVGGSYRVPLPKPDMDLVMSGSYAYGSTRPLRFLTSGVVRETLSDVMHLLKTSIALESSHWTLEAYADNLTNDNGAISGPDINNANTAVRQRPRTIGLQFMFNY